MPRHPVPRAKSAQGLRGTVHEATAALGRDRREGALPSTGRAKSRPLSAQAARRDGAVVSDKTLATMQLQEKCLALKREANSLTEVNTKVSTRLSALKRELKRRARLLHDLVQIRKAGQCIDMEIIEKLKEERNMLPIVQKKAQDLQHEVENKDAAMHVLKHDPQFTRIIELQVEYATWQHEACRLDTLLQDAESDTNDVGGQEIAAHRQRRDHLQKELDAIEKRGKKLKDDMEDEEEDRDRLKEKVDDAEAELRDIQEEAQEVATDYKDVLQKRRQMDQMKAEIDSMQADMDKWQKELESLAEEEERRCPPPAPTPSSSTTSIPNAVSQAMIRGPLPASMQGLGPLQNLLGSIRRASAVRSGEESLFAEMRRRDSSNVGLLSVSEVTDALAAVGVSGCTREEIGRLVELAPALADEAPTGVQRLRWLDFLLLVDRSSVGPSAHLADLPPLPDLRQLRMACLRSEMEKEDFEQQLCAPRARLDAEAFFVSLGLSTSDAASWASTWEAYGPDGLLLMLPMSEIAIRRADFDSWFSRCVAAVSLCRRDVNDAFNVWPEKSVMGKDRFKIVFIDSLGHHLSPDDIDDLWLFIGGGCGGAVDAKAVLNLAELRKPVSR